MFIFGFITGAVIVTAIICSYTTSKINTANTQSQQKQQKMQAHHKSELAAKDTRIADLENEVAYYKDLQKSFSSRWQQLTDREHKVEEKERDLERRERELEQRWQSFPKEAEEIIARRVEKDIKGKEKGINKNWKYLFRKEHKLAEYEQKILKQAQLIADHLGVPIRYILTPREKKLVDQSANELTGEYSALREEHYVLIDLVMSCPEDQLKDMLASMQRFDQSWPGSPPPPPESEN